MNVEYRQEGIDGRRLWLRFLNKVWIVALTVIVGAVLGGLTYQVIRTVKMPVEYQAVSKLYITFGYDESGEVYQYYNGYTWNDLMSTEPILDRTMAQLSGYTTEEVTAATRAEILSDIRVLTITISGADKTRVEAIAAATNQALVEFADASEELVKIEPIKQNAAERVYWNNDTITAVITGAVIGLVLCLFILAFYEVLQEGIYVASDVKKRYSYPLLGTLTKDTKQDYVTELLENSAYLLPKDKELILLSAYDKKEEQTAELLNCMLEGKNHFQVMDNPLFHAGEAAQLRQDKAVVVVIPFGASCAKRISQLLDFLEKQDVIISGFIITGADGKFLHRYYR